MTWRGSEQCSNRIVAGDATRADDVYQICKGAEVVGIENHWGPERAWKI